MTWIERARSELRVLDAAQAFGLSARKYGSAYALTPCPHCGAERRHTKTGDRRGAVGVRPDGTGWRCFQCDAGGDALDLVAYRVRGQRLPELDKAGLSEVRAELLRQWPQWDEPDNHERPKPLRRLPEPTPPARPRRPPAEQLHAVWERVAVPVEQVPEVADWVRLRGFEPEQLDGLARALPAGARLPAWCRFKGKSWSESGHQLVVLMHGATGQVEGLHARSVRSDARKNEKAGAMAGVETRGLVMSNDVGRYLLQWGSAEPVDVVVSEGEPDWLTACSAWASKDERACFGIVAGSWSAELAKRIPSGSQVTVRTHNDADGDKYAARILETLGHCRVLRGNNARDA